MKDAKLNTYLGLPWVSFSMIMCLEGVIGTRSNRLSVRLQSQRRRPSGKRRIERIKNTQASPCRFAQEIRPWK